MKNLIILIPILFLNHNLSFAQEDESNFKFFDSSEEIIPLKNLLKQLENAVNLVKQCQD